MKQKLSSSLERFVVRRRDMCYVRETLNGSQRAFSKLAGLYYRRIFAVGMRFFRNRADAEDFTQTVFMKAYEKLSTFRGDSLFSTWLTRIAFTTAMNMRERSRDTDSISDETLIPGSLKTPEEELIFSATAEAVKDSLDVLPVRYAECVRLYFFSGMSHEEISFATGIPVNTVKSHIFRAKKILGKKLEDYK
ncbi:RNA polymerase sigma factor [Treponema sp.]|uniref:RNA polymerase sigma factor n=1 Tax=Treponema sp. TaxID=166 RepID=UPI003EFD1559